MEKSMSKINTQAVREKVVDMMGDLKGIVDLYMSNGKEVAAVEGNSILSREYKDGQIAQIREKLVPSARSQFDNLQKHFEELVEVLRVNDDTYDFSDPEFASCIALMSASEKPLPAETILGVTEKFLGNRQALLALAEVAKGANESTLRERIFNTESEAEVLQERLISLDIGFPKSIIMLPSFRDDILKIVRACGEELTNQEKDLGAGYQEIATMQIRAAMGLPE